MPVEVIKRFKLSALILCSIMMIGTLGYWLITGGRSNLFDCLYMTIITILTVGFEETVKPEPGIMTVWVRTLTIFLAFTGIGTVSFIFSNVTAIIVEGQLKETFKKRRTNKLIRKMENHFIVCGAGRVGAVIVNELHMTKRHIVVIERNPEIIRGIEERFPGVPILNGNADFEDMLVKAEIKTAAGIFAATGDDNQNLIISLTSKYINPNIRVVARCLDATNYNKMEKAGADAVIAADFIAGMRMASEMVRPTAVNFLDKMRLDKEENLRVEEISIHKKHAGKKIKELGLENFPNTLLLAIISPEDKWTFVPKDDVVIMLDSKLVVIANPEQRLKLIKQIS